MYVRKVSPMLGKTCDQIVIGTVGGGKWAQAAARAAADAEVAAKRAAKAAAIKVGLRGIKGMREGRVAGAGGKEALRARRGANQKKTAGSVGAGEATGAPLEQLGRLQEVVGEGGKRKGGKEQGKPRGGDEPEDHFCHVLANEDGHLYTHAVTDLFSLVVGTHLSVVQEAQCLPLELAIVRAGINQVLRFHEGMAMGAENLAGGGGGGVDGSGPEEKEVDLMRLVAVCNDCDLATDRLEALVDTLPHEAQSELREDVERAQGGAQASAASLVGILVDVVAVDVEGAFLSLFDKEWRQGSAAAAETICATVADYLEDLCARLVSPRVLGTSTWM
jgi:hypothetical protein